MLMATLSTFFAGRGETRVVLIANVVGTLVNAVLDYLWIFGRAGFPRAGVAGAAWATVISQAVGALLFLRSSCAARIGERFHTLSGWRFESKLFGRLLRFGLPAGPSVLAGDRRLLDLHDDHWPDRDGGTGGEQHRLQPEHDRVHADDRPRGRRVRRSWAATLGVDDPTLAERATWSAFAMSLVYMSACGALYVLAPGLLLGPTRPAPARDFASGDGEIAVVLLRFVAVYSIFDMFNVIFAAGLRGAGDTATRWATVVLSWAAMLIPAYLLCVRGDGGCTRPGRPRRPTSSARAADVPALPRGRWRTMRVIEPAVPELDAAIA